MVAIECIDISNQIIQPMMKIMNRFLVLCIAFTLVACNNTSAPKHTDTSISGQVTISVDESLKPIIEAQREVFEALYPDAKLNMIYTNEYDAIHMLAEDSSRIAIVTREMLPTEKTNFDNRKIVPNNMVVGYDAISVILNKNCKDTIFTIAQ